MNTAFIVIWSAYIGMFVAAFAGYVMNIITIVHLAIGGAGLTVLLALRVVGIFAFPLGAVLGYF